MPRRHTPQITRVALVLTLIGASFGLASPASAGVTIVVSVTTDDDTDNGNCTLREAVLATNANGTQDQCVHDGTSGTDVIELPPDTYTLSLTTAGDDDTGAAGDLDIADDVDIDPKGALLRTRSSERGRPRGRPGTGSAESSTSWTESPPPSRT